MCFSAPASFTASAVLATLGTVLICRTKNKRLLPLALIPWFFALQQGAEGVVWLSLTKGLSPFIAAAAKNVFLFFAFVFWPVWVPLSLWIAEKTAWRKQVMAFCLGVGLLLSFLLVLTISSVNALPYRGSIHYLNEGSISGVYELGVIFYGIATMLPLFFSSLKKMWALALLITLAGVGIYLIDHFFFISLWCFFAALLSLALLKLLRD